MTTDFGAEAIAIDNLMGSYALVSDTGCEESGYRPLFAKDCVVTVGSSTRFDGIDAVLECLAHLPETMTWASHQFARESLTFSPDGDRASTRWSLTGLSNQATENGDRPMVARGRYRCELVKSDGTWRFQSMDVAIDQFFEWRQGWIAAD
jgi:hypothetical protein